jgi:hypothetical protein
MPHLRVFDGSNNPVTKVTLPKNSALERFTLEDGLKNSHLILNMNEAEHLKAIIDKVDDINIIGAGLFSQWRYYNHWAYSGPGEKDKEWFLILLHRLKEFY